MQFSRMNNDIALHRPPHFILADTLDCGQAFRWVASGENSWQGVVKNRKLKLTQIGDDILFHDTKKEDFENIWLPYFDLARNYSFIFEIFSKDPVLKKALAFSSGIRLLQQDTWEVLCSFIFSQNNHIPRIKGIIERFCQHFGQEIADDIYTFPSAKALDGIAVEDLAPIRSGFRAKYIVDAVEKINKKEVNLSALPLMPIKEAREEIQKIKGVSPKVGECILLFGAGHMDAFPIDVWMQRALDDFYPKGLPSVVEIALGIAQQVLFHYRRHLPTI